MKKALILLCSAFFAGKAYALEPGDSMPDLSDTTVLYSMPWIARDHGKVGVFASTDKDGDGQADYGIGLVVCNQTVMDREYAIHDIKADKLYVDRNLDGIVDLVLSGNEFAGRKLHEDAPTCEEYRALIGERV